MCKEYGIWTSKSTSPYPKIVPEGDEVENPDPDKEYGCREPILVKLGPRRFLNAVGLTNLGAEVMREKIIEADIPDDRVKIGSIFGKTLEDYVKAAVILEDAVDVLEGNYSCPNSEKEGMIFGQDPEIVYNFTKAIVDAVNIPFLVKLTPNMDNVPYSIGDVAKASIDAGAYGVVLINTSGPHKNPHLYFGRGGESGAGIRDLRIECVREVREAVGRDPFISATGGIFTARDVRESIESGANAIGIGTALFGMNDQQIISYLPAIVKDLINGTDNASQFLRDVDMTYHRVKIEEVLNSDCDFKIFRTYREMKAEPGQFVYGYLPNINGKPGEKPFSVMDDEPLTLGVQERGYFTKAFNQLKKGDYFYFRGPYGKGLDVPDESDVVLVGGGCGIAGINLLAKRFSEKSDVTILLAAKDKDHISYLENFRRYGEVKVITEDGSLGRKGLVTGLFGSLDIGQDSYFFNCGPKAMVNAILPLELEITRFDRIYSSVDRITRCGMGGCGSCADSKGRRTCVEGPFISEK